MSAPHVTGAVAVLKSSMPQATVDQVLAALTTTGVRVTDPGNGIAFPRLQLDEGANAFDQCVQPPADVVLDNDYVDVAAGTLSGGFNAVSSSLTYGGTAMESSTAGVDTFRFRTTAPDVQGAQILLPSPGKYRVWAWWSPSPTLSTGAVFDIQHAEGIDTLIVDQAVGGGDWFELGVFTMAADGNDYVQVSDSGADTVQVDAIRFEFLQIPALLTIDTGALPGAQVDFPYAETLTASCVTDPVTWSVSAGTLPAGLNINAASGEISGQPTNAGASSFTVRVQDANLDLASRDYTLVVLPGQLGIETATLPDATAGAQYSAQLTAARGTPPYSWQLAAGSEPLPAGLALRTDGLISGIPTSAGTSDLNVQVTDADASIAFRNLSLTVSAAIPDSETVWFDDALPAGATGRQIGDVWQWVSTNPAPFSGALAHQSLVASGQHLHYFQNATETLQVGADETLFAYVYLDPDNPPSSIMLGWYNGSWEHRAYWGANRFTYGVDGTASRRPMGPLPPTGQWVRLEVPARAAARWGRCHQPGSGCGSKCRLLRSLSRESPYAVCPSTSSTAVLPGTALGNLQTEERAHVGHVHTE
jgi:hypothetical protein